MSFVDKHKSMQGDFFPALGCTHDHDSHILLKAPKMNILGVDSDEDVKFSINKDYADRYDRWREGEELQKLKDKYGNEPESGSSSSEDEDEDAKELTKDIENDFFKTLSCLKEKNPKIYDKNVQFFTKKSSEENNEKKKKNKSENFFSLGEYQRKFITEMGGHLSDEEDQEKKLKEMTNVEQEKAIKESFKDVLRDSENESEGENADWGGLFKKRIKTKEELETEEDDFRLWLAGQKEKLKNSEDEKDLKGLHDFWSNPMLDENEQFLRDYILNKRFLEEDKKGHIPTYDEVVHDSDSGLSADESSLQQQEEFERKYNFRFEEPDQEFIKRYPRTLEQSMRKKDDRRKKHRQEVKERKKAEKEKKVQELKRLKALKRKEILEKIQKLQEITGNEDLGFQKKDIEEDFDPEKYDKRMSELFNEEYYGTCGDEEKPEYPELDEELEIENWDEWGDQGNEEELHCEDPGFNMDCDYDPNRRKQLEKELTQSSRKNKKRRQSKFAAAVAKEKPLFDPKDKSFEKYIDEYYSLDYEDLIGDLPCRFKYRKVIPNDFGLSVEEILGAPDRELNSWVSVKKIMQRRPEHVELYDVKAYKKKARDIDKKKKCLPSLYAQVEDNLDATLGKTDNKTSKLESNEQVVVKSKKFKKGKQKSNIQQEHIENEDTSSNNVKNQKEKKRKNSQKDSDYPKQKKKKESNFSNNKMRKEKNSQDLVYNISDSRLKSYGINPKKLKNKLKYKGKH